MQKNFNLPNRTIMKDIDDPKDLCDACGGLGHVYLDSADGTESKEEFCEECGGSGKKDV